MIFFSVSSFSPRPTVSAPDNNVSGLCLNCPISALMGLFALFYNNNTLHLVFVHLTSVKVEYLSGLVFVVLNSRNAQRKSVCTLYFPTFISCDSSEMSLPSLALDTTANIPSYSEGSVSVDK